MEKVLHIGTDGESRLFLWIETAEPSDPGLELPEEWQAEGLEVLPIAASHQVILSHLGEALKDAQAGLAVGWFPRPIDEEEIDAAENDTAWQVKPGLTVELEDEPGFVPWVIPVFFLDADKHLELIAGCHGKEQAFGGLTVGEDAAYIAELLQFASAVVARFRFRRAAIVEPGRIRPGWRATLTNTEKREIRYLYEESPSSLAHCFVQVDDLESVFRQEGAGDIELVNRFVDALLHRVEEIVKAGKSSRKQPAGDPEEQWLRVLKKVPGFLESGLSLRLKPRKMLNWWSILSREGYGVIRAGLILSEPGTWSPQGMRLSAQFKDHWRMVLYVWLEGSPSTKLPFPHAMRDKGGIGQTLRLAEFNPEGLLEDLFAPTGAFGLGGYRQGYPGEFFLTGAEAGDFLKYIVPELKEMGFELSLPKWYTGPDVIQEVMIRGRVVDRREEGVSAFSLDRLLEFRWEVAVGDKPLARTELRKLLLKESGLVQHEGGWLFLREEDREVLGPILEKGMKSRLSYRDAMKSALTGEYSVDGLPVREVLFEGRIGELIERLESRREFQILPQPKGFVGQLRPYQVRGYSWLAFMSESGLGACLADDMGLGKTIQTLALLQQRWESGQRRPVLLVCPTSVVQNWKKEAERFTPELPVLIHHGSDRDRTEAFVETASQQAIVVSSYSLLYRDLDLLQKVDWAGVVLDEAQNIKNPKTKQSRAARSLGADFRIALTGTPVENNVGELWSIMDFLNPGWLGSYRSFKQEFWSPIEKYEDEEAATRLRRLVQPFILRREKTDREIISDLPEKLEMKVYCNLTKEQGALYETVLDELERKLAESEGMKRRGVILAALTRLKQICNHPAQFLRDGSRLDGRSGKLSRLVEMLEEVLSVGDRALVFTQFAEMGSLLQQHLSRTFGVDVLYLHGGVPRKQRDKMVSAFQEKEGPPIFVLSLKAGGLGLNLTRANHVFHFDRWWNPAVENQATDRAFRIGQERNVQVHKFICVGTLEESIDEMIERKKDIAERIVGSGEAWLTELSNEEIRKLVQLRPDAIGE